MSTLYVAMTRARSMLAIFGKKTTKPEEFTLLSAIEESLDCVVDPIRRSMAKKDWQKATHYYKQIGQSVPAQLVTANRRLKRALP